jgi:starch phosphorylase
MNDSKLPAVAYFSMEYAIAPGLRTYAGGLGILAGDYLKGAKDYFLPITGIGIKWRQGYGEQFVDKSSGFPYDCYKNNCYDSLEDTGLTVDVMICGRKVYCRVFRCRARGADNLYLLDTDIPENDGEARWITGQLYGWFGEERVAQEMVLGIGGLRALRKLGIAAQVYHFNEGHALFAGFELLREKMETGMSFDDALRATRREVVFTTHTPVIEGNESHPLRLLQYMGAGDGLTESQLVSLGGDPFNMTAGALRVSGISNAVSQLHAQTANKMWSGLKGRSDIIGITNAIHAPTWVDRRILDCAAQYDGSEGKKAELWALHMENKRSLLEFVKSRTGTILRQDVLTIGFSRRAVDYKRSDLIFTDSAFIGPLLKNSKVQIILSGKAHPLDDAGKKIVQNIVNMAKLYPQSVVFLENYDMTIGRMLTRGCDLWLNNPRRPKEASGTSGMKAAMNGVLNFSVLDGWWPEICRDGENGWQIGDGFESEDVREQDENDLRSLAQKLSGEILPAYYESRGKWVDMMAESIKTSRDKFDIRRMLDEYYRLMYQAQN